jgi:NAD(P)H-flavin reductase/formate hydrogenlyase subunit 6/NADH:ubiquinone oxidoreductase subunit I
MVSSAIRAIVRSDHGTGDHRWWLPREDLGRLVELLRADGRTVVGPVLEDGTVVYREIESADELPAGVVDTQAPGMYRTHEAAGRPHTFDFASPPTSWKRWTFPPRVALGTARRDGTTLTFEPPQRDIRPLAFLGARACDLAAIGIQDRVLAGGPVADEDYRARRSVVLTVGIDCATPSSTCFCASMGTGPEVTADYDLALTELDDGFVVRVGTDAGHDLVDRLDLPSADPASIDAAREVPRRARAAMTRTVVTDGLPARLMASPDHPRWAQIAERCLACTSCTMVCPTCFCTSVTQVSDLDATSATSHREWDSCFTLGFGAVAGGNFRTRRQDRYRQWLTHKFGTWVEQFGTMGCVGCGRCITWCPVGIDVRDELDIIAAPPALTERPPFSLPLPVVAANPGKYAVATVTAVERETVDTWTLTLEGVPEAITAGRPGQFLMVDLPGYSAAPISVSRYRPEGVQLTIRAAGPATGAITSLVPGSQLGLRGPLGRGWPADVAEGRDVLIVAGGIGLAPLRPLIEHVLNERGRFRNVRLAIGARTPEDLILRADTERWRARDDATVEVTVDRAGPGWSGPVGVVTQLFDRAPIDPIRTTAYLCGPERMMQAAARVLGGRGLMPDRIFVSMERHMDCGVGLCGHCQMGRFFVCKDGPVFSRAELGDAFELEGI